MKNKELHFLLSTTMSLLVDRKAPKTLDDLVLQPNIKATFEEMIKDPINKFNNMTLAGIPGIGKTAIAKLLARLIKAEVLFLNASKDNNVDTIRSKVSDFCGSISLVDQIKIVILDEADSLTIGKAGGAGAQEVLRGLIEEHQDDCRFILTCNYVNRIIPALISRCPIINIQFTPEMVLERVGNILKDEGVKIKKRELEEFYETVIKTEFPKIRNIIHSLDTCISADKIFNISFLESCKNNTTEIEKFSKDLYDLILNSHSKKQKATVIRQFYIDNVDSFGKDYQVLANNLFNHFSENPIAQITIADYIFKMSSVIDPEVQFYAMIVDIMQNNL